MRSLTLMIGAILCGSIAPAQDTFLIHFDSAQAGNGAIAYGVEEVADGYLVFGQQYSHDSTGAIHVFVRKVDLQGQFILEKEYFWGNSNTYNIAYIDPADDDGAGNVVAGVGRIGSDYSHAILLFRFDLNADTINTSSIFQYGSEDSTTAFVRQVRGLSDGGFVLGGGLQAVGQPAYGLLVRVDQNLDTLWSRLLGEPGQINEILGLAEYRNGELLVTGYRLEVGVNDDSFLIRTDSSGSVIWRRQFGGVATSNIAVRATADTNIVTWSEFRLNSWPLYWQQMMLTKWDSAGYVIWQRKSHYSSTTHTFDMEVLPDGSFITTGSAGPEGRGVLARFSSLGDSLWSRSFGVFDGTEAPYDVLPTSDGGFILCGLAFQDWTDPHPGLATQWVAKTDSFGCVVPGCQNVGVQEYELGLQEHLVVGPNPAHDRVSFTLELPNSYSPQGAVHAVLLDATGRQVMEEVVPRIGNSLSHTLNLQPSTPSGLYYLHLRDQRRWLAGRKVVLAAP